MESQRLEEHIRSRYARAFRFYEEVLSKSGVPVVLEGLKRELKRQYSFLNLIASESLATEAVLGALGGVTHNQTFEGRVGHRWFPETDGIDAVERAAAAYSVDLFGLAHANVQPHSATQANQAVMLSCLRPGDRILALGFTSGAHLSHGMKWSFAGRLFDIHRYQTREDDGWLDYDHIGQRIDEVRPRLIISGASAYPRQIDFARISKLAQTAGALHLADIAHIAGLVCSGVHPAAATADFVTLSLHKTMLGPRCGIALTNAAQAEDLDRAVFPGAQGAPMPNLLLAKAIALAQAKSTLFCSLQKTIVQNGRSLADSLRVAGLKVLTGGTDTHLVLVKAPKGVDGIAAERRLLEAGVLANRNYLPGDRLGGRISGLRFGTTVLSQLGFTPEATSEVGSAIGNLLNDSTVDPKRCRTEIFGIIDRVLSR